MRHENLTVRELSGLSFLNLSGAVIGAGRTDGALIKAGSATSRIIKDVADTKFMAFYFDNGASSGDNRGMYLRQYLTGGAGGEALRVFNTVENVTAGTAHGAHISLNFGATGKVSGLGVAMRATLHIANQATQSGTMAAIQAEIYSDGTTSDPASSVVSCIRVVNDGSAKDDVDDDAFLLDLSGWTKGAGHMVQTDTGNVDTLLKCRDVDGTNIYIMCTKTIT